MNLIVAELIISSFGIPVDTTAAYHRGWRFARPLCTATGFVLTFAGMLSIYTLSALSLQRWMVVTKKPLWLDVQKWPVTVTLLASAWASAAAMALPPLMGWAEFVPETSGLT